MYQVLSEKALTYQSVKKRNHCPLVKAMAGLLCQKQTKHSTPKLITPKNHPLLVYINYVFLHMQSLRHVTNSREAWEHKSKSYLCTHTSDGTINFDVYFALR